MALDPTSYLTIVGTCLADLKMRIGKSAWFIPINASNGAPMKYHPDMPHTRFFRIRSYNILEAKGFVESNSLVFCWSLEELLQSNPS